MRFTVQALEEGPCAAGGPHVLQIKLLGDGSREPSSWKLFADGACVADGSGAFARECFYEGAEVFLDLCRDTVRAAELRHELDYHAYRYYMLDAPEITDAAFDKMLVELQEIEATYPDLVTPDSYTQRVGGYVSEQFTPVTHMARMYRPEHPVGELRRAGHLP